MRTISIGLDGCSWNVLEPLLESGELPNLTALRERSAHGELESTIPFFTGPAWASYATGASPAAHGIYDFMMLREGGRLSVASQADLRRKPYHQQLGEEGKRSVLINMPLDQSGCEGAVIVNSWLTDDGARRILPVGRRERYERLLRAYRTFPTDPSDVEELCAIEQARFDLARELFLSESWDHFFVLFSSTDWLGHAATGAFLRGDGGARDLFLRLYRDIDRHVGWFVDRAGDATVFVLSDHGQCGETAVVRINALLLGLGLAELKSAGERNEDPAFASRRPGARFRIDMPRSLGYLRSSKAIRPVGIAAKRALRRGLGVEIARPSHPLDRSASRVFCPTDASFAIYARDVDARELEVVREALLDVRLPDGRSAIENVWTPEELYGRSAPGSPALLFAPAKGVRPSAAIKDRIVDEPRAPGRGCHQREGILLAAGPQVVPGEIDVASICDVAPTILWTMSAGVPAEGDGRVLYEAFEASVALTRPLREVDGGWLDGASATTVESDEVARRLKALGYI